jgi:hypothetical protein
MNGRFLRSLAPLAAGLSVLASLAVAGPSAAALTLTTTTSALLPAAAHSVGSYGTSWRTDLWISNPNSSAVTAAIRFLPANADNSGVPGAAPLAQKAVPAYGTVFLPDVLGAAGLPDNVKGALRIDLDGNPSRPVVIGSRTYNRLTAGPGTYGQYVPAYQGSPAPVSELFLTGLREDAGYRTNVGFVSASPEAVGGIVVHVLNENGIEVGSYELGLYAYGMTQVDSIVSKLSPSPGDLSVFSVKIDFIDWKGDPVAQPVMAYASVIDNRSGDGVFVPARTP